MTTKGDHDADVEVSPRPGRLIASPLAVHGPPPPIVQKEKTGLRRMAGRLPSGGPAIALGIASMSALGAIAYSHYQQVRDREVMRAGVYRDKERLRYKRQQQQGQGSTESSS